MDFKEKWDNFFRSERKDLKKEIRRVKDEMESYKPGTVKYKQLREDYELLFDREVELTKFDKNIKNGVVLGCVAAGLALLYQWICEHANNPFTREVSKMLLKITGTKF